MTLGETLMGQPCWLKNNLSYFFYFYVIVLMQYITESGIGRVLNCLGKIPPPFYGKRKLHDPCILAVGLRDTTPHVIRVSVFYGLGPSCIHGSFLKGKRQ